MHGGYRSIVLSQQKYKDIVFNNTYWRGQQQQIAVEWLQ